MNKMTGIILIVIGAVLLIVGVIVFNTASKKAKVRTNDKELNNLIKLVIADGVFTKSEKDTIQKIASEKKLNYEQVLHEIETRLASQEIEPEAAEIDSNKKNGDDFEKYIAQKFDTHFFKIKEWTGDKYANGIYAETTPNPDLVVEIHVKNESKQFAVECKWRKNLYKSGVDFAKVEQFERYKKFQRDRNIPVYISIGVGGSASNPEHLFVVPLSVINGPFIHINILKKYAKNPEKNFFFDMKTEVLS